MSTLETKVLIFPYEEGLPFQSSTMSQILVSSDQRFRWREKEGPMTRGLSWRLVGKVLAVKSRGTVVVYSPHYRA